MSSGDSLHKHSRYISSRNSVGRQLNGNRGIVASRLPAFHILGQNHDYLAIKRGDCCDETQSGKTRLGKECLHESITVVHWRFLGARNCRASSKRMIY